MFLQTPYKWDPPDSALESTRNTSLTRVEVGKALEF